MIDFQESSYAYDDTSKWSTKIIISGSDSMVLLTNLTTATIKFALKDIQETISLDAMLKQCDSITKEKPEYAQQIPESQMTIFHQSESVKLKFIFSTVYGYHTDSVRYVLQHISGKLLYLKK